MAKTIIHKDNLPYFGDEPLLDIAPKCNFSEMIFELLSGKKPGKGEARVFETILNLSIDHGTDAPSAVETIKSAKEGKTISESVAAGIMQINDVHGGAIEPAMEILYRIKKEKITAKSVVEEFIKEDKRLPGYGHRIYEIDPRAQLIFKQAREEKISEEYIEIAKDLEKELKAAKGKILPVNIDGAIAAVLCAFGWDSKLGKAVFIIARTPGLCGQYLNNS